MLSCPAVDEFCDDAGAGEDDGPKLAQDPCLQQAGGDGVGALNGVDKDEMTWGGGCPRLGDRCEGTSEETFSQLRGIADRR